MTLDDLKNRTLEIVAKAQNLNIKHTDQKSAPVNYACIFAHSEDEFTELVNLTVQVGCIVSETKMGPVFKIEPFETIAGPLQLLKIRRPDLKRLERGDADFTVSDYKTFKSNYLYKPGFSLITRPEMEMIELVDPAWDVLTYYSNPTLLQVLGLG